MIGLDQRSAILTLDGNGLSERAIARAVGVSRNTVRKVLKSGSAEVPPAERGSRLDEHRDQIVALFAACKGNRVRVHEELVRGGVEVAYTTLTDYCRREGIGVVPKRRVGQYHFEPGEEMQHDTSPHDVTVGGKSVALQCASLVLCFSRRQYAQVYPRWSRLECRHFLVEALQYLGGVAGRCMLDNSTVIMAHGTGRNAVPAPEMKALADRFGFEFVAHRVGDANRSARVERPFSYIENNFYPGRTFEDLADLNRQLRHWCDQKNRTFRRHLGASPDERHQVEQPTLRPLPPYVPPVYALHNRTVSTEGYVWLHTNRYSVDTELIGHKVEVHETIDRVRIFDGHELAEQHVKLPYGARERATLDKHRGGQQWMVRFTAPPPSDEEQVLRSQGDELVSLLDLLQKRHGGRALKHVKRLYRMWTDYPSEPLLAAIAEALRYGLIELKRIERMVLRRIAGDYFRLPVGEEHNDG